jgi:hypothetical protein
MRVIYKYELMLGYNSIWLPAGYKVLKIAEQHGNLTMWVEQDSSYPASNVVFNVYGTGYSIPNPNAVHVGSELMESGLVWHVYAEM